MELLTAEKPGASHVCCPGGALLEERMPNPLLFYFSQACVRLIDQIGGRVVGRASPDPDTSLSSSSGMCRAQEELPSRCLLGAPRYQGKGGGHDALFSSVLHSGR